MPKISIIMPSFNVAPYIRECMDSVLAQTLSDIEVIVVDADSTDGTREILEEYAQKDSRVVILEDDKKSTGYANNKALDYATGEYSVILTVTCSCCITLINSVFCCGINIPFVTSSITVLGIYFLKQLM